MAQLIVDIQLKLKTPILECFYEYIQYFMEVKHAEINIIFSIMQTGTSFGDFCAQLDLTSKLFMIDQQLPLKL